jgi:hypothetical protein
MKPFKYNHLNQSWYDNYNGFYFIDTYPSAKPECLVNNCRIHSCREFFTKSYDEAFLDPKRNKNRLVKAYALVITGKRWTQTAQNTLNNRMTNSLSLLNRIEKHFGRPLTRLYPVDLYKWVPGMFFIGSKRWLKTRYSFSLWTLIIRYGWTLPMVKVKQALDIKDFDEFIKFLIPKNVNTYGNEQQLATVLPKIKTFMEFEKTIGSNYVQNWSHTSISESWVRAEGIQKLVTGNSKDQKFEDLWSKFVNKK